MNTPNITFLALQERTGTGNTDYRDNAGALQRAAFVITVTALEPGASVTVALQASDEDVFVFNTIDRLGEYRITIGEGLAVGAAAMKHTGAATTPANYRLRYEVTGGNATFGIVGVEI